MSMMYQYEGREGLSAYEETPEEYLFRVLRLSVGGGRRRCRDGSR